VRWNKTRPRNYDEQRCPGELSIGTPSVDDAIVQYNFSTGISTRLCDYGGVWHQPNVSNCATRKFINIKNKVFHEINIYNFCTCSVHFQTDSLNATDATNVTNIITELVNITKPNNQSQLPRDILIAAEVLDIIINRYELLYYVMYQLIVLFID